MVRVKQFADDLAISTKKAKDLINKGRNRKDGGSQILESAMSDTDKKKKKKKKQTKSDIIGGRRAPIFKKEDLKDGFRTGEYRKEMDNPDLSGMTISRKTGGSNVVLPKKRPTSIKKKKTSEQIIREKNEYDITKSDITESLDKEFSRKVAKQNEEAMKNVKKTNKKKDGGFPDLTGDGKVTKKDILKGRGVPGFSRGGGIAIQGLGFKGVR